MQGLQNINIEEIFYGMFMLQKGFSALEQQTSDERSSGLHFYK
jgi:hypothetical protein